MLTIQRNGMGPPFFRGAGFGDAAGVTALQTALTSLSQVSQNGAYNPLRTDGVLDNQTLAAIAKAALTLNIPILKDFIKPLKSLTLPLVGSVADALTNVFAIAAIEQGYPGKVNEIKNWITANASKITLGLNAAVALVGVNSGTNPAPPSGGGGGNVMVSVVNPVAMGAGLAKYGPGAITSYFGGKWHVAKPRPGGGVHGGLGIPIYNAGTGLGIPIYNAGTGLGIPIYNAGTGLTGAGQLGAAPTHQEVATEEHQPAGVNVVDKKPYQDAVLNWFQKPLTIGLGTAALVGLGVGVWLLVR